MSDEIITNSPAEEEAAEAIDVEEEDLIAVRERLHEAYEGNVDDTDKED